jgi:hypothetical protein
MYIAKTHSSYIYALKLQEIYYGKTEKYDNRISGDSLHTTIRFDLNTRLIQCTYDFGIILHNKFFEQKIKNKVCKDGMIDTLYKYYYCEKGKININEMENINFVTDIQSDNMTFVLEPKDLFFEHNDLLYFLVIYKVEDYETSPEIDWIVGTPFLKKNLITFNRNDKLIYFYKKTNNENNGNEKKSLQLKYIITISVLSVVFLVSIVVLILYIIKIKPRKKKANELDDDFDYQEKKTKEGDSPLINDDN